MRLGTYQNAESTMPVVVEFPLPPAWNPVAFRMVRSFARTTSKEVALSCRDPYEVERSVL